MKLSTIAILAVCVLGVFFAIKFSFTQQEKAECNQWAGEFASLKNMAQVREYLSEWETWQAEQCEAVGIDPLVR